MGLNTMEITVYSQDFEWWYANTLVYTSDEVKQAAWYAWGAALKRTTAPEVACIELLRAARCPNKDCERGAIPHFRSSGDLDWEQCQWCDERKKLVETIPSPQPFSPQGTTPTISDGSADSSGKAGTEARQAAAQAAWPFPRGRRP